MASITAPTPDGQTSSFLQAPVFIDRSGRQSPRPNFSFNKPSWIGPRTTARSTTPEIPKMAEKIEIHYRHPGLQPPVFIAGSMCEPQWEPVEMAHKENKDGELDFEAKFNAEPGEYQYKFRLGPGDWWVLDESKPIVDDGAGNRNNLLVVESKPLKPEMIDAPITQIPQQTQETPVTFQANTTDDANHVDDDEDDIPESEKNLFKHETIQSANDLGQDDDDEGNFDDDEDEEPPLLEHEAGPFKRVDSKHISPLVTDSSILDSPAEFEVEADDEFADDGRDAPCPLFRHETGVASDADPDEAPLFRHESMSPIDTLSDVNDPSLERFPTDQAGIFAHLQRAETRHRDDEVVFEGTPPSPSLVQTKSFSPQAPPATLYSEASDLSHLDSIDETDEEDDADVEQPDKAVEKAAEKKDSIVEPVSIDIEVQDVSELDEAPLNVSTPEMSNRGPPTPPMTPTEHAQAKAAPHDGPADAHDMPRIASPRSRKDYSTDHIANRSPPSKSKVKPSVKDEPQQGLMCGFWVWFASLCGGQGRATGVAIAMSVAAAAIAMNTRST